MYGACGHLALKGADGGGEVVKVAVPEGIVAEAYDVEVGEACALYPCVEVAG